MPEANDAAKSNDRMSGVQDSELSIILVSWNGRPYLDDCLQSIYKADLRRGFEVIVVDNGSTDGSMEMIRACYPEVKILFSTKNLGFAAGVNTGLRAARNPFALLLNTDAVINQHAIEAMVNFMQATPDAAAVGGTLLNPNGSFQAGYANFSSLLQEFLIAVKLGGLFLPGFPSHRTSPSPKRVDWVPAACLLVRPQAIFGVGGFDEEYFCYSEEVDLQFRLKKAGWKVYYLPDAQTVHYGGTSSNRWRRRILVYRGKMLFYRKNYSRGKEIALRIMVGIVALGKCVAVAPWMLLPGIWCRARKEWKSNAEIVKICFRLS